MRQVDINLPQGEVPALFDKDPARWRPQFYPVTVECDTNVDGTGKATVTLNNQPFILQRITHAILGNTLGAGSAAPAVDWEQDGQYLVSWRDDSTTYQPVSGQADAMFGSVRTGNFQDLPAPVVYPESKTITIEVTNLVDRSLTGDTFKIMFILHGVEQWAQ